MTGGDSNLGPWLQRPGAGHRNGPSRLGTKDPETLCRALKLCGLLHPTALPGAGTLTCLHPAAGAEQQVAQKERYRLLPHGGAASVFVTGPEKGERKQMVSRALLDLLGGFPVLLGRIHKKQRFALD